MKVVEEKVSIKLVNKSGIDKQMEQMKELQNMFNQMKDMHTD